MITMYIFLSFYATDKAGLPEGYDAILEHWKEMQLDELCQIPKQKSDCAMYTPSLVVFKEILVEPVTSFVRNISFYKNSNTFQTVLQTETQKRNAQEIRRFQFFELFDKILNPAKEIWETYCNKLQDGTITIEDIEILQMHKVDENSLQKEFTAMNRGSRKPWIKTRISEFQRFKCFSQSVETARLLKRIRETNEIVGNFDSVELIERSVSTI
jgi:hypothetical protein